MDHSSFLRRFAGRVCLLVGALCALVPARPTRADTGEPLALAAAGSLRGALDDIAREFTQRTHIPVRLTYGPAGQLSRQIARGEHADMFLSANTAYPLQLVQAGLGRASFVFVKNSLCFIAPAQSGLTTRNSIARLLDPAVHIGISTPGNDPGGDYAWQVLSRLEQAEHLAPGSVLYRARALVGGAVAPPVPPGVSPVAYYLRSAQVDMFIAYCSQHSLKPSPDLSYTPVPDRLSGPVEYAALILDQTRHRTEAEAFGRVLLSQGAQRIFRQYGFISPGHAVAGRETPSVSGP
ncbi:molybdate ABC transporter substrate-binding protein [Acetobacter fabarum]|uniref:molybdate ABC transporter substrate-binding protein n=1 Tax=Acetobacter fabarum TaxID=483199 RepID=UPI00312B5DE9